jgi:hypothetical protein
MSEAFSVARASGQLPFCSPIFDLSRKRHRNPLTITHPRTKFSIRAWLMDGFGDPSYGDGDYSKKLSTDSPAGNTTSFASRERK